MCQRLKIICRKISVLAFFTTPTTASQRFSSFGIDNGNPASRVGSV
ncbi:MAG: hypothetical protein Q4D53_08325 [Leptotrichiaceae bacterium]|nr:hypothetical protein [Leptotrichiaceae bacterium]